MRKLYASSLILLTKDNKIVLQKRDTKKSIHYSGCWGLIGGAAFDYEDAKMCIERECFEETKWKLPFFRILFTVMEHCIETVFFSRVDTIESLCCCEGKELKAFEIDEIGGLKISHYHKLILNAYIEQYHLLFANQKQLRILFYTKVLPPHLGGYVTAGCNLYRVLMSIGETTIVTDDSLNTVKGQYDLLFFNSTYENQDTFDVLREHSDRVWSYEHNTPVAKCHQEIYHRYQESEIVFVPSQYLRDQILSGEFLEFVEKIHILPIPIDLVCFDLKQQDEPVFSFTTICAIKEIRNLTFNIDIIKCLIDKGVPCRYDIYGMVPYMSDSSYLQKVKSYIAELKLGDVVKVHHAIVSSKCVSSTLKQYNFYIDFAQYESYGQAKIEALASGLNLIMPPIGNNPALLPSNCVLFDGTPEENAEMLLSLFGGGGILTNIKKSYREHAELNFSDEIVSEIIKKLL